MEDSDKPFSVDRAKLGRAACKKCKEKCLKGDLRIAKVAPSPYGEGKMKMWHHLECMFEQFLKQRPTTKRLENSNELEGWESLDQADKDTIAKKFEEYEKLIAEKNNTTYSPRKFVVNSVDKKDVGGNSKDDKKIVGAKNDNKDCRDCLFKEFRRLVANITNVSSYTEKTAIVNKLFTEGSEGGGFKGDIVLWCKLLLPGVVKRIYNLQSKQLVKLFSHIFSTDHDEMLEHLEQGDIGETIQHFHEKSLKCKPATKSVVTVEEVEDFLEELSGLTKEEEQIHCFRKFIKKCTSNDLKIIIRLIKHDLRMNAGAKHILEGVHPDAYESYQSSRDLKMVIKNCLSGIVKTEISVLTPVLPMLAEPCRSIKQAMEKCPNGMYSEIKYDGERVQVHKKGNEFRYYSRSLKPVLQHKIKHFKEFIPKAFPHGKDLILDSEILMVDTETGMPLPFGTLGIHKKNGLDNAAVCLFVFDCIYFNGEILTDRPIKERKRILRENMTEIKNHIMFSEMNEIDKPADLAEMICHVLKLGLEGLVLKDKKSIYEPGKRHWLKVKKDYLFGGAIADSADLIVLGAWYGTGKKGGIMSVFLMGVHDPIKDKFLTVTKVHTGHDDKTLEQLQDELDMIKISKDSDKIPSWLKCTKTMVPDFVAKDPKKQPVWEITGAEFTQIHDVHTANGISIRFPRVTRIRDDKTWSEATNLQELNTLFKNSKEKFDASLFDDELKSLGDFKPKQKASPVKRKAANGSPIPKKLPKLSPNKNNTLTNFLKNDNAKPGTSKEKQKAQLRRVEIKNPLPDYFNKVALKIADRSLRETNSELLREFVAFGGTILKDSEWSLATHVLHESDLVQKQTEKCPVTALHIVASWLEDCVVNESLLSCLDYAVTLLPNEAL